MKEVYVLEHSYELDECDESKLIGIYSSKQAAQDAITRLQSQPGFRDYPDNFTIDRYVLDQDHWKEGFITMQTIYMPLLNEGVDVWRPVQAVKRSNGYYEVTSKNDNPDDEIWAYKTGDIVSCELKEPDGKEKHLVIIKKIENAV